MSLLDKITGLAQKAKENVVSKTFTSKDRRLEQSLSENIKVNDIFFQKMSTYGLPSVINVIAFDCIAGLLAVAGDSNHGYIKVFGKGISTIIRLPNPVGIKHLQFKTGYHILVVIDKANHIITIDLRTNTIRHVLEAQEIISSQAYCLGTDWLFIGYANGFIDVFDIMQGIITPYQIPDLLDHQQIENVGGNRMIVDLQMHPNDLNTLLIGYESIIFIWNVRENTIRKSYKLNRSANLTCLNWSPNGAKFIGGYDDGFIHIWDVKNDQKPIFSRKLSEAFYHPTTPDDQPALEPIYQIAWYSNEKLQRSYIIVAGGINSTDIQGLNVLEFELDNEARDPKKQTILPLPADISHFAMISSDPYNLYHNSSAIAVICVDYSLRIYSLDHGFPLFKLPPALEFLGPNILAACHVPQLPSASFKTLAAITKLDRQTKYFPITGGVAGPDHVYHIDSNDLLITIHQGEVVKFWDASYTALRPLTHLTIHCLEEVDKDTFLCCLDVNKENGNFTIGYSDGSIVVYECQVEVEERPPMDPRLMAKNEEFINSCDDTLKEISELLEDMGHEHNGEQQEQPRDESTMENAVNNTNPFITTTASQEENQPVESTNPFVTLSPTHHDQPQNILSEFHSPEPPARKKSKIFKRLDKSGETPGYYASLKISLNPAFPITSAVSIGDSIIAVATDEGKVTVIDIHREMVLFTHNIAESDYHNTVVIPAANLKTETAAELQEADPELSEVPKKPASITTLNFFNTYSPSNLLVATTQLFVGLSNGHIYQFNLSLLIEKGPSIAAADIMHDYLTLRVIPSTRLLAMFVIDLKGQSQLAVVEMVDSLTKQNSQQSTATTASSMASISSEEESPKPSSNVSNSNLLASSKRMAAIGKADYRYQENPHLIVCISLTSIILVLSGFNIKLFSKEFKDVTVHRAEIIQSHDGVCLCVVMSNGKLGFYTLPTLDLMLEMKLPQNCVLDRLSEISLSKDGRIVFWTGKYEMEQYSFTPKPDFPIGESVILFDSQKAIPPHPSLVLQQQPTKKTWLDTVAGAFSKEPLTLPELDLLMGRVPMEDPKLIRQQKMEAYKAKHNESSSGSSSGPGGVFSQLGEKMNERGERLNQLDKKFEDMNAASGDFLKAVREYNDRQSKKKWWEF